MNSQEQIDALAPDAPPEIRIKVLHTQPASDIKDAPAFIR